MTFTVICPCGAELKPDRTASLQAQIDVDRAFRMQHAEHPAIYARIQRAMDIARGHRPEQEPES